MATVVISDLDDEAYLRLKASAEARGGSIEGEARAMLEDKARGLTGGMMREREEFLGRLSALRTRIHARRGMLSDTTALVRELRKER